MMTQFINLNMHGLLGMGGRKYRITPLLKLIDSASFNVFSELQCEPG